MQLLDRMSYFWRRHTDSCTLVVNCDPSPRSTSFSARLCNAYMAGAKSAARSAQYLSVSDRTDESAVKAWKSASQNGLEVENMMLILPIFGDAAPPSLCEFFSRPWTRAMSSPVRPRTIRIVFTTEIPAFLQRAVLQRCTVMQKFYSLFPTSRIRQDFIGSIDAMSPDQYLWWIATIREYGTKGI